VLLSGGASAMLAAPAEQVELADKCAATATLLQEGADIAALNTVRKHLSAIKGGWLAAVAAGPTLALAVSDVVGDSPSVIASGPTVADPTTFRDAIDVVRRFGGPDAYPRSVVAYLAKGTRGEVPDTPKPGDPRLARADTQVIGGRADALDGARAEAMRLGYATVVIEDPVTGEARVASPTHLVQVAKRLEGVVRPACVLSAGETTVRVVGRGTGGRNQEFALAAARGLNTVGEVAAALSLGSDGADGPTDAAGAIVDTTTMARSQTAGLGAPDRYLDDNNAYAFFNPLGDLVRTGPTGTNVGDLQIILVGD